MLWCIYTINQHLTTPELKVNILKYSGFGASSTQFNQLSETSYTYCPKTLQLSPK